MGKKHEASLREIIPFTMFRSPWINNRIAAQDFRRSTIAAVARIEVDPNPWTESPDP